MLLGGVSPGSVGRVGLTGRGGAGGESYDADAQALFARFTSEPDDTRKGLINALIVSLKAAGVWTKLDVFYVLAAHDAQAARRNWKADAFNLTAVNSPTFTMDRGYAGNGSSSRLTTNWDPATNGVQYTQNASHLSLWDRTSRAGATTGQAGGYSATSSQCSIYARWTDNKAYAYQNDNNGGVATTATQGLLIADRASASALDVSLNDVSLGTPASLTTAALGAHDIYICGVNANGTAGTFSTDQIAAVSLGASLGATARTALYSALNTYLTAIGAA